MNDNIKDEIQEITKILFNQTMKYVTDYVIRTKTESGLKILNFTFSAYMNAINASLRHITDGNKKTAEEIEIFINDLVSFISNHSIIRGVHQIGLK